MDLNFLAAVPMTATLQCEGTAAVRRRQEQELLQHECCIPLFIDVLAPHEVQYTKNKSNCTQFTPSGLWQLERLVCTKCSIRLLGYLQIISVLMLGGDIATVITSGGRSSGKLENVLT